MSLGALAAEVLLARRIGRIMDDTVAARRAVTVDTLTTYLASHGWVPD